MRIGIASWTRRQAGGVESYLNSLIPALRARHVDVSFFHETDLPGDRRGINTAGVPMFAASAGVDAAIAALAAWKPDVMYMHGLRDPHTFERLTALAPSATFVHTYLGTCVSGAKTHTRPHAMPCDKQFGPMCLVHYFPRGCGGKSPFTMWQLYRKESAQLQALRRQNAVITHSAHMQAELAAHGVSAHVIPYGVTLPDFDPTLSVKSCDLLFAGRMDRLKGGGLLLDAVELIRNVLRQPLRVVFAGDGPERSRLEARAREITRVDREVSIDFAGWCDELRLGLLMSGSRLLVVPSVWPEPFGSVGMAAARHGVPAAAFAVGGIPQWLHDGVNGHLAPASPPTREGLADAIVRCLSDPSHYEDLSGGARQAAAMFTMDRHLPELMRILEAVAGQRRLIA
jgi:glycosyltransferase involved in cell wall biosynthesis